MAMIDPLLKIKKPHHEGAAFLKEAGRDDWI
jgi:hypothetical protein